MGVEIQVEGLTKSFGRQVIWQDVSLTLPPGEISVMLGPSGTGKSVFLKTLVGLLKPDCGSIMIEGRDLTQLKERDLYEVRKLFGVLFQDGALFGSMSLYDNIAFPLREHTRKSEKDIRDIVMGKMDMVGLLGSESKLPGEISGGMRKRAGLAAPTAEQYKAVVQAEVAASSVVSGSADRVVVLLFVNQTTTSTRLEGPKVDLNRVRLTLEKADGRWLVSDVRAL